MSDNATTQQLEATYVSKLTPAQRKIYRSKELARSEEENVLNTIKSRTAYMNWVLSTRSPRKGYDGE
jgi:hypothetical protein